MVTWCPMTVCTEAPARMESEQDAEDRVLPVSPLMRLCQIPGHARCHKSSDFLQKHQENHS